MACNYLDPASCVAQAAQNGMQAMATSLANSASWAVKNMTAAWLRAPSPDVSSSSSPALWLQDRLAYFVLVAVFVSILYAAYRMATSGTFEDGAELGRSLARLIVVSGCVVSATSIGIQVGDAFTTWLMGGTHAYVGAVGVTFAAVQPGVVILLALVVILAQCIQLFLMFIKNAMLIALVAFIPLTSAATNTPLGKQGFHKAVTWLAAFLLYKPVAAVIYVISFKLSSADQTIAGQMSGIALMLMALFALPALMKFLVPVTVSVAGGNAGAMAGATVGAALATGAVIATGGAASGAGGFGSAGGFAGAAGPSGAPASSGGGLAGGASGVVNAAGVGASVGTAPSRAADAASGNDNPGSS